jgi:condensin-2 complex subunit D3
LANLALIFEESANNESLATSNFLKQFKIIIEFFTLELRVAFDMDSGNKANILNLLHRRASDDKCTVRKASLQVLEMLGQLGNGLYLEEKDLVLLQDACQDPALSIRKQGMISLTQLLRVHPGIESDLFFLLMSFTDNTSLANVWLNSILPLVMDAETTVQEKCVDFVEEIIFAEVINYSK